MLEQLTDYLDRHHNVLISPVEARRARDQLWSLHEIIEVRGRNTATGWPVTVRVKASVLWEAAARWRYDGSGS